MEKDVQSISTSDSVISDQLTNVLLQYSSTLSFLAIVLQIIVSQTRKLFPFIEVSVKDGTFFLLEKQQPYGCYKKMSKFHQTGCFVLGRSNHIPAHR